MKREFDRKIWKSGNSYVVTIPSETVERYNLENKFVTIAVSDENSIIIKDKNSDNIRKGNTKAEIKEKGTKKRGKR